MPGLTEANDAVGGLHESLPAKAALVALQQQIAVGGREAAAHDDLVEALLERQGVEADAFAAPPGFRGVDRMTQRLDVFGRRRADACADRAELAGRSSRTDQAAVGGSSSPV